MRRQRWVSLVMIILLGLLAACGAEPGGGGGQGSQPAADEGDGKIHLVYFNARSAEIVERKLIERYTDEHPNIEIEYLSSTALGGASDTDAIANLIFNIQANTVVDVAKVEVGRTPLDLMAAGASQELTAIGGEAVKTHLATLQNDNLVQIKGGVWALPYEYDPFGYVYNAAMFREAGLDPDQPPKTWDELRAAATAIKAKFSDSWPICHPLKNLSKIQPYIWGAGGTYWDTDVLPTKADLLSEGTVAGYSFIQEWAQKGWINTEELTTDNTLQFMISRQCAGINTSSNMVMTLRLNDPSTDWRVAPIAAMDANHEPLNFAGGSALIIPSTSRHPKEALDFMTWLTSEETQRLKYGIEGNLHVSRDDIYTQATPASRAVVSDPRLTENPSWKGVIGDAKTRPAGISPAYSKAYEILAAMQERIIRDPHADVRAELTAAQAKVQALIDESVKKQPDLYKP